MSGARKKTKFYAVTHGGETGVFTNCSRAGDSVLGFAQAKYKGFSTYSETAAAMDCAGMADFVYLMGKIQSLEMIMKVLG